MVQGGDEGKVIVPGKSKESLLLIAVSQLDDETAMPPKRGRGGPGGFGGGGGGGFGGPGGGRGANGPGRGGRGQAALIAPQMFSQADTDADKKMSQAEFVALADLWFDRLDTNKAGKVNREQFTGKFGDLLPQAQGGGARAAGVGRGPGGQRGGEEAFGGGGGGMLGRIVGPGFFTASDVDTNGSLTRAELKGTFAKWFSLWDTNKTGALNEDSFRGGLNASLPSADFGGGGRGPGGPGGFGGFGGGRRALAQQMMAEADSDKDASLTKAELTALSDAWWDKLDAAEAGRLTQEQFSAKLARVLAPSQGAPSTNNPSAAPNEDQRSPGQRGGGGGFGGVGGGNSFGPALFIAADADKDAAVTRAEFKAAFEKWFAVWDTDKKGSLNEETLYAGLSALLPQRGFGGFGGGGPGGQGGGGPGAGAGPAPQPLTAQQVGLVRAWIDQGAK